jgi:hypothetical protein
MADTQKTTTGAPVVTNSYAPNNGLFNCFDDINSCLLGLFCEPINLGMLAKKTNTGDIFFSVLHLDYTGKSWWLSGVLCARRDQYCSCKVWRNGRARGLPYVLLLWPMHDLSRP